MNVWLPLQWVLILLGAFAGLYLLYRLGLWLEARRWLYYKNKKPGSSAGSCFVALQQVLDPPIQHFLHVKEEKRCQVEKETARQDESQVGT